MKTYTNSEAVGLGETLNDNHELRMNMMTTNYSDEACNLSLDFWIPSKIIASKAQEAWNEKVLALCFKDF